MGDSGTELCLVKIWHYLANFDYFRPFLTISHVYAVKEGLLEKNWPQGISSYFHPFLLMGRADWKKLLASKMVSEYLSVTHF